jgi:hypothetical protein
MDEFDVRMPSHRAFDFLLITCLVTVIVGRVNNSHCIPTKFVRLSNCTFYSSISNVYPSMTIDNRTLSMIVPNVYDQHEHENFSIDIIQRSSSTMSPLVRLNLNMIQCLNSRTWNWTSVEASSTINGEFIRTTLTDRHRMYLSMGVTYLRNLTSLDCSQRIVYRTDHDDVFRVDFKLESTLNDTCSNSNRCYPLNIYQCDYERHRCTCRSPLQTYLTNNHQAICIHAVKTLDQCTMKHVRCLPWCHRNHSSTVCLCPEQISTKKYLDNNQGNADE